MIFKHKILFLVLPLLYCYLYRYLYRYRINHSEKIKGDPLISNAEMNRNFEMFFFFLSVLKCFKIKSVSRLKILFQYIFYKFSILFNTSLTFVNTLFDSPLPGFAQSFFLKSFKTIWLIFAFVWVLTGHFYPHVSSAFAGYSIWFDLERL